MINQSIYLSATLERLNQQRFGFLEIEGIVYNMRPERDRRIVRWLQHWLEQITKRKTLVSSSELDAPKTGTSHSSLSKGPQMNTQRG